MLFNVEYLELSVTCKFYESESKNHILGKQYPLVGIYYT